MGLLTTEQIGTAGEDLSAIANVGLGMYSDAADADKIKKRVTLGGTIVGILTRKNDDDRQVSFATRGQATCRAGAVIVPVTDGSRTKVMMNAEGKVITAAVSATAQVVTLTPTAEDSVRYWIDIVFRNNNGTVPGPIHVDYLADGSATATEISGALIISINEAVDQLGAAANTIIASGTATVVLTEEGTQIGKGFEATGGHLGTGTAAWSKADTVAHTENVAVGEYIAEMKAGVAQSSVDEGMILVDLYGHNNTIV